LEDKLEERGFGEIEWPRVNIDFTKRKHRQAEVQLNAGGGEGSTDKKTGASNFRNTEGNEKN